jgi:tRNA-specific 2-thiouridylase
MSKGKILVGMSGGVDSSSTCALLLRDDYEVEGITLDYGKFCEKGDIEDSQKVAQQLGIKHHVVRCEDQYEENVVKYFINSYTNGETPNPCANCNKYVKFPKLFEMCEKLGADFLATGHYAQISEHDGIYWLEKGIDITKDQSYFIGQINYDYLQYLKFPLGGMKKSEVREFAKGINLYVATKPESQDMCLAKGKDYREILKNYSEPKKGDLMHVNGKKVGEHEGIGNYTQGQRKGLGIGGTNEPLFVISIDARKNIVYVGAESDLFKKNLTIGTLNFLDKTLEKNKIYELEIKLRSTNKTDIAEVVFMADDTANITLKEPSRNVSKGQLCGMYRGNRLVGSGFIIN